jgi:NitT/TauT family transport system substrate-binding protein
VLWPHVVVTLKELILGFAIGATVGLVLAAIITQFPFVEKIVTPYILLLVTTPMVALVPLLILRFGFGSEPRIIAVALAVGPMVMINSATGFRRVDLAKIALARSFGASTFQVYWKIRIPMALPMVIVGLMVGSIFGLLTAVGAELVGGKDGLGNRLSYYSSLIQMPQFFACIVILALIGVLLYVTFFLIGKKSASQTGRTTMTVGRTPRTNISRRRLLVASVTGMAAVSLAGLFTRPAQAVSGTVRWVSPRGTIEVLDDYPYWVAKKYGYFGDIETTLEPGPADATATVKLVDQGQADMGYPSPGVFSLGLAQGIPLVSVFHMGGADVFDFAFRPGERPANLKALEGKTILVGSAGWQSIADPMLLAAGVDITKVKYLEAGWPAWGTVLKQGQGDSALSWEGLRAQWKGQGLVFDYFLGRDFSKLPANSFVIRKADFDDGAKKKVYARYLQGWAAGLEFGKNNPRAATQIVMEQFPGLASQMTPDIATESMMQLANVFAGRWDERKKWGFHILDSWKLFFETAKKTGQISGDIVVEDVVKNDLVDEANSFDAAKVKADADGFKLSDDYSKVDVAAIAKAI